MRKYFFFFLISSFIWPKPFIFVLFLCLICLFSKSPKWLHYVWRVCIFCTSKIQKIETEITDCRTKGFLYLSRFYTPFSGKHTIWTEKKKLRNRLNICFIFFFSHFQLNKSRTKQIARAKRKLEIGHFEVHLFVWIALNSAQKLCRLIANKTEIKFNCFSTKKSCSRHMMMVDWTKDRIAEIWRRLQKRARKRRTCERNCNSSIRPSSVFHFRIFCFIISSTISGAMKIPYAAQA